ncbi:MAG: hypothetical protein KGL48_04730 [Sphingomonadales bacterium]|nr:hypothetical protein [Sphingomonadales bacterium]MDE2569857.1 hypothetical protein [Sphingomonadales bacterium]
MRNTIAKLGLALAAASMLAVPGAEARTRKTAQEQLAGILKDRVAGEPVDCIWMPTVDSTTVIDKTAIVYRSGSTYYVNYPRTGAESLNDDDILVTRLWSSNLCSIDTVQLHDRMSGMWSGFVGLGKFVPYKREKVAAAD